MNQSAPHSGIADFYQLRFLTLLFLTAACGCAGISQRSDEPVLDREKLILRGQLHQSPEYAISTREQDFEIDKWKYIFSQSPPNAVLTAINTWGSDPGQRLFQTDNSDTVRYLVLAKRDDLESAVGVINIYPSEKSVIGVPIDILAAFFNRSMFEALFHEPVLLRYFVYGATLDTIKFEGDLLL
jgi:hypothetical protein